MSFPLSLWDISLWLAITAVILLITSELLPPYCGETAIRISKKRLRRVSLAVSILFVATAALRILSIVLTS